MNLKVKKAIELAEAEGWKHVRTNGDHRIFVKEGARRPLVISGHLSDDIPPGTQASIKRTMRGG